jgi:F0F1-type ATP synthase assembly protein I
MQATGNYWPDDDVEDNMWTVIYKCYFILVRIVLIGAVGYSLYYFTTEVNHQNIIGGTITFTFFLDIISVLPTQYLNQIRLQHEAITHDCAAFSVSTGLSEKFLALGVFIILVAITCGAQFHPKPIEVLGLTISEISVVFYLTFNLWFLVLDLKVSGDLVDELMVAAQERRLNLVMFNEVRSNIHRRVQESKWVSDFILLPCIASIVAIVVMIFHLNQQWSTLSYVIGWTSVLIKEMIFIGIAFCFVASVNGKADALTEKLSSEIWTDGANMESITTLNPASVTAGSTASLASEQHQQRTPLMKDITMQSDIERLTMCVSSLTKPISFTLLFKRVSWTNVLVSAAGIALTISIGLVRSLFINV